MKKLFLLSIIFLIAGIVSAQTVDTTGISNNPFDGGVTATKLVNVFNVIYGALVIAVGYVVKIFKVKYDWSLPSKRLPWIILAAAVVLGIAFVSAGFLETLPALFTFLGSIGIYDFFLKPLGISVPSSRSTNGSIAGPPNVSPK